MSVEQLQALAALVSALGTAGTLGLIALVFAVNLAPVLTEWLRSLIKANEARAERDRSATDLARRVTPSDK